MKTPIPKIILCFLLSSLFFFPIQAQESKAEGPSIEETVEYINKIVSTSIGQIKSEFENESNEITEQYFSLEKVTTEEKWSFGQHLEKIDIINYYYNDIPWGSLKSIKEEKDGFLVKLTLDFEFDLIRIYKRTDGFGSVWRNEKESWHSLRIYVQPQRVENVKKAFFHLKKLMYKEDPFGN